MSTQQPPAGPPPEPPTEADRPAGASIRGQAPIGPEQAVHIPHDMVDFMRRRAERRRDRMAFSFSRDGEERESSQVSYLELDAHARQIAVELQHQGAEGECVLVFCPPGIEFIVAYFGCLYAGAIAVPVHPPTRDHLVPRVESILADMQPGFAISTAAIHAKIKPTIDGLAGGPALRWSVVDTVSADGARWVAPEVDPNRIAMVQYTSGSTSAPKGVILSHGNLVHNMETIRQAWGSWFDRDGVGVFWLPPFHDMGLIGGLLSTLYVGGSCVLMPPTAFIKGPMRWLEAMSKHRAVITAAPNFAYDLCAELSTPEQREALDLSHWTAALCGAEPVRTATLDGFAGAFAPSGFRREAFLPVYGLAEGTLLVSGGSDSPVPVVRRLDRPALRADHVVDAGPDDPHAVEMIGCGKPQGGQRVAIVDPETRLVRHPDEVGEIWVSGPSVAQGYWESPELTEETFAARLADGGPDAFTGPFLRTGDLGFLRDGELYVTGRRKDLIIIRGANFYPNDIELTVQDTNPALLRGRGAVFSVEPAPGKAEQLVITQEVNHLQVSAEQMAEMIGVIRTVVTERYGIRPHAVLLVEGLQLPTTSSGKIQRSACKEKFLDGALPVVSEWSTGPRPEAEPVPPAVLAGPNQPAQPAAPSAPVEPEPTAGPDAAEISAWLVARLARELDLPVAEIDPSQPFAFYGLDSVHAVRLSTALEKWLHRELEPTLAYEYPTIDLLAAHLAGDETTGQKTAGAADTGAAGSEPAVADDPIAIVGIGCRFPGADGPQTFWQLLASGTDATSEVPPDRWDADAFYNPDPSVPGTAVTRRGGFLEERIDCFDYHFFGISPRESAQMDPQQRLLLEVAWEALEDAGQVPEKLAGSRTGVFVGISTNDYGFLRMGQPQLVDAYTGTGNALSIAANRLSYVFDFHGPSMAVDTACSSSLVAVDLACRRLRDGECELALAGGVNVMLSPALSINFSKARVMAPDGRCKTFDADADGYVRGEGAGVVVLKPLSRALADADPIYAVIRGSATNSDGRTNGLIAPGERSQEKVLAAAYRRAGISPGTVQYVEAHGTGTAIGDAIEAKALGTVLADGRPPGSRCLVGSVKTNIGHLEAAAGVAGLIKVALALQHRAIPASINFSKPNPHIAFDDLALDVVQQTTSWPGTGRAVAGVSSFGFGGTNAHVVLTEAPQVRGAAPGGAGDGGAAQDRAELLPLSARSPEALAALVGEYEMALFGEHSLADLCYTAGARRGHHDYRLAVVGDSPAAMFESLAGYRQGESRPGLSVGRCRPGQLPRVTFVFSGQGSQWRSMGHRLADEEPVFRDALEDCDRALRAYLGSSVLTELAGESDSELSDIGRIQPAIFAVQVALAALWRSWGVEPAAIVGHSMGEVAAAHVAGALSLDDAARVIYARAHQLHRVSGRGAMVVAEVTLAEAEQLIAGQGERVAIAANNSDRSTVLSGEREVLTEIVAELERRERFCRWIDVDVASHGPQMAELGTGLRGMLVGLAPTAPTVPIYSAVTGDLLTDRLFDADYWVENLCSPVRFSPAVQRLMNTGHDVFVEISPHPILLTAAREDAESLGRSCTLLSSLRRDEGRAAMLASLGTLYTLGQRIDWEQVYPAGSRCVAAPTYPWQRVHSWLDAGTVAAPRYQAAQPGADGHLLPWRGPLRSAADPDTTLAEVDVGVGLLPGLADHRVHSAAVLPVVMLLRLIQAGAARAFGPAERAVRDVALHRIVEFTGPEPHTLQLVFSGDPAGQTVSFQCYHAEPGTAEPRRWSLLAAGTVSSAVGSVDGAADSPADVVARCPEEIPGSSFYRRLADGGLEYGPGFQAVEKIWRRDGEAVARLAGAQAGAGGGVAGDSVVLDAGFQTLAAALAEYADPGASGSYLPSGLTELRAPEALAGAAWSHAVLHAPAGPDSGAVAGDVFLLDAVGDVIAAARGLQLQRISGSAAVGSRLWRRLYQVRWHPADDPVGTERPSRTTGPGRWLLFTDGDAATDAFGAQLAADDQSCVVVEPGAAGSDYQRLTPDRYRIDPDRAEHFRRLLDDAFDGSEPPCRGIVHLWSLLAAPPAETSVTSLKAATTLGPLSVLYLLQALSTAGWSESPRLWLVTGGAQAADPSSSDPVAVAQAPLWGMGRSIDHEQPELRCSCVDLSVTHDADELAALLREVWADGPEVEVALRGRHRYVARLDRYDATEDLGGVHDVGFDGEFGLNPEASYLITGGLGDVGQVVAGWMVEHGARHLVLMGRSGASATTQAALDQLRAAGAEVVVARGDVTEPDQLAAVLESIRSSMPPLRGVLHAAGLVDVGGVVERLDERQLRDVMAPKVEGAWNLHALTRDADLDFFVLFSSAASILGSPGASNYAAANAFLDALAWHRHAEGRPALCVNWGPWAELGMLSQSETHRRFTRYGVETMSAGEYLQALAFLLTRPTTQVAVFDIDWARWRPAAQPPLLTDLRASVSDGLPSSDGHRAAAGGGIHQAVTEAAPEDRQRLLESYLAGLVAGKLGLPPAELDIDAPLNTLGVDSLITLELRIQVERELGVVVPVARLLDGPSVVGLSGWLVDQLDETSGRRPGTGVASDEPPVTTATAGEAGAEIDLLAKVPELSDEAVDEMLRKVLSERGSGGDGPTGGR